VHTYNTEELNVTTSEGEIMNKNLRIGLMLMLAVALLAGIAKSFQGLHETSSATSLETVRLLAGSAKFGFLKDPELRDILAKEGLQMELTKSSSFDEDVTKANRFDAVWPAGANAAADFAKAWKAPSTYLVFSTPLAIASWKPLVKVLEANGLAKQVNGYGEFYLEKALPLMNSGTRWNQLRDNTAFSMNKGFLVNTPDARQSTTAALYISALAYLQNGNEVPQTVERGVQLTEQLASLITRQGYQEGTLAGPFEDYIGPGMGKAPLVLIYESQFIEAKRDGVLPSEGILLYPQPGLVLKHTLVGRTAAGQRLGELLSTRPDIQAIAAKYGFRPNRPQLFHDSAKQLGLNTPELLNLAEAPSTRVFDAMNQALKTKLEGNQQ
jgi:hypothetical protein